jgi:hypothetical protein
MSTSTLDLSHEKPAQLEATTARFGAAWRKHGYRTVGLGAGMLAFIGILLTVGYFIGVLNILKPNYKATNPMEYLYGLAILGASLWVFFMALSKLLSGCKVLLFGAPRAARCADETIRQFVEPLLAQMVIRTGKMGTVPWLQAYVCLLDQVKTQECDLDSFVVRMQEQVKIAFSDLQKHFAPKSISGLSYNTGRPDWFAVTELSRDSELITYEVAVRVDATEGINSPGLSSVKDIGSVRLVQGITVAQIGDHWYLAEFPSAPRIEASSTPMAGSGCPGLRGTDAPAYYCLSCNADIDEDADYCPKCGADVSTLVEESSASVGGDVPPSGKKDERP